MLPGTRSQPEMSRGEESLAYARTDLQRRLEEAIERAVRHLLSLQAEAGFWLGELEADTTLESDYIFYLYALGRPDPDRVAKLANYVRRRQLPDGGWNIYPGGAAELNATIKAYFALKLAGDPVQAAHMVRACQRAQELGGVEGASSYTRFYLALCGAASWEMVPALPPELMLLPRWLVFNIWSMSSWTRAILVPLTILYALRPRWPLPPQARVDELFRNPCQPSLALAWDSRLVGWRNLFLAADRVAKFHERLAWKPLRRLALRRARGWLLEHLERSEGLGAIYPAMLNSVLALLALGYSPDDPLTARQIRHLAGLEIEDADTLRLQPCLSPVWDTAIAMTALQEAGLPADHPALVRSAGWLLENQVLGSGDWQVNNRDAQPGGWAFEFRNDFYPDVDDTAVVLLALEGAAYPDRRRLEGAIRRGLEWAVSMQNRDGGWGAFDRDNDCAALTHVPFADHNAMIDPSTADVTARVLEFLGKRGWPASHPIVKRARAFIERDQTPEGAWYGRWGVNYVYGTSGVLRAMKALGLGAESACRRGASWLRAVQNADGGWGESCASYDDPSLKGQGESTPSQTAWGLLGLLAAGEVSESSVTRAVQYLLERQQGDGSWSEANFTGTGFPRVFYLKYHLYRNSFPLYALARYRNLTYGRVSSEEARLAPDEFEPANGNRRR
jgi:squalene-hopene/tetraprenyl-beta-curcumene cyclase